MQKLYSKDLTCTSMLYNYVPMTDGVGEALLRPRFKGLNQFEHGRRPRLGVAPELRTGA